MAVCVALVGCGSEPASPGDGGTDATTTDAGAPKPDSGKDASVDVAADAANDGPIDEAATDAPVEDAPIDAPIDAPLGSLTGSISMTGLSVYQDCMPMVAQDPVHVALTYSVTNNGNVPVGPITPTNGRLLDTNNAPIITFTFNSSSLGPIAVSGSGSDSVTKQSGTANPASYCQTLSCNSQQVKVEMELSGTSVPPGYKLTSGLTTVSCVY